MKKKEFEFNLIYDESESDLSKILIDMMVNYLKNLQASNEGI